MSVTRVQRDPTAVITLDRHDVLNALSFAMLRDLGEAFDRVAGSDARAVTRTGAGTKAFRVGADIKELRGRRLPETEAGADLAYSGSSLIDRQNTTRKRRSIRAAPPLGAHNAEFAPCK